MNNEGAKPQNRTIFDCENGCFNFGFDTYRTSELQDVWTNKIVQMVLYHVLWIQF